MGLIIAVAGERLLGDLFYLVDPLVVADDRCIATDHLFTPVI